MSVEWAESIARMRVAFRGGLSHAAFVRQERAAERPTFGKTDSLAAWRSVTGVEKKTGLLRFVRKDRYPTNVQIARAWPEMSAEYMYQIKVHSVIRPGEAVAEHFVNIMSDVPMTPEMAEMRAVEERSVKEKYAAETLVKVESWTVIRRVLE